VFNVIGLKEHIEISDKVNLMEGESPQFTDEQLDAADYYQLKWNAVSGNTVLSLYDANGDGLGSVEFEDADVAVAFIEEYFDLDEDELEKLENYSWVDDDSDNYDDRVRDVLDV
jgi:hypothetical protein